MPEQRFYATGKRKTSIARVWLQPGTGLIVINRKPADEYLDRETSKMVIAQPLVLTGTLGKLDVSINVLGGGISGQAGAIRHGISKALLELNPEYREVLETGRFPYPRLARQGTQKVWPQERQSTIPVFEALIPAPGSNRFFSAFVLRSRFFHPGNRNRFFGLNIGALHQGARALHFYQGAVPC